MNYTFENIQFNSDNPIKIFIHNLNYVQNHWHDAFEILFILDGEVSIGIANTVYTLQKEDLIVINPHEIHTTSANSANLVLLLQISSEWIHKFLSSEELHITCNSSIDNKRMHMDSIRKLLAQMMWCYNNHSSHFELRIQSYLYELMYQLFVYFKTNNNQIKTIETGNFMPRLSNMIDYLHENYDQNVSLQDLAEREYLSVSYVSRFFKKYIGTSFKEYVIRIRLEHAVKDLLYTEKSISQLAFDNGFPNTNSFFDAFKETYNEAPSTYRKKAKEDFVFLYGPKAHSENYQEIANLDVFKSLYKYLNWSMGAADSDEKSIDLETVEVDINRQTMSIAHTWKNLMTIGKAKDALNPIIQAQLSIVQKEIGFRYIRFHGIFDDEMSVYQEDEWGHAIYDFSVIDQMLDYFQTIQVKPYIELGFMPRQLAKKLNTMFKCRQSYMSMPKDIQKWCDLVESFIRHCMKRYGMEEVESWYFEFWNEPDIKELFWFDTTEDYYFFYEQTYKTMKRISTKLQIGGPSVLNVEGMEDWLKKYFTYCQQNDCMPDILTFHFYLHTGILMEVQNSTKEGLRQFTLSSNPNHMKETILRVSSLVQAYQYEASTIHLTEWNASPSHRELSHDTLFMAAYIVKNVLENMDTLKSFGFWTITDYIEEFPVPEETFHGGLGILTKNGLKKAGYYAFRLMSLLGNKKVVAGEGYYVTKNATGLQIMLYNYCHYDPLYCSMDHSGIYDKERYGIYKDAFNKTIQLQLNGFENSLYELKEYIVCREHGSAFDTWVDLGAPHDLSEEAMTYIQNISVPQYQLFKEEIEASYLLKRTLTPHEVRLIMIVHIEK